MILCRIYSNRVWIERAEHLVAVDEKVAFYLLTYGLNTKKKKYKRKESIRSINPLKLMKRV